MSYTKVISPLVACILIALFATPVLAQTAIEVDAAASINTGIAPPPLPTKPLDIIKARALQVRQGAEQAQQQVQDNIGAARDGNASTTVQMRLKNIVRIHAGLIKQRFQLAIRHFDKLLARIESRIEKLKSEGVDTASVEVEVGLTKTASATAKADIQAVGDFIDSIEDTDDRRAAKAELDAKVKKAQSAIRAAHQQLMKTVRSLVALSKGLKVDASATTSASVQ